MKKDDLNNRMLRIKMRKIRGGDAEHREGLAELGG